MLSNETIQIIQKYPDINTQYINNLNGNLQDIIMELSDFRDVLISQLKDLLSDSQSADDLYKDIKALNEEIDQINLLPFPKFNPVKQDADIKEKYNEVSSNEVPPIDIYSVFVLKNTFKCSANHNTKDVMARIPILNGQCNLVYKMINASYCFDCKRFTMLKSNFMSIKDTVMCKIIDETTDSSGNINNKFDTYQKQSILCEYGYNVQAKKNLSQKQRQIILSSIIESNIMNRNDIVNHINFLIERGIKTPSWNKAVQKWREDKEFVLRYKDNTLPNVFVNNLILKYKKSKNNDDENIS